MGIYYQLGHEDYGWVTYTLPGLLDEIKEEIEANDLFPGDIKLHIKVVEMTEHEFDNLTQIEDE